MTAPAPAQKQSDQPSPGIVRPVDVSDFTAASTFTCSLPPRPYPGLRPFEKSEWPIFFGRERTTDEVVARLQKQRILIVHGDSGCGKSSLIAAGVLPRLEQEAARGGLRWRTVIASPGDDPLRRLTLQLAAMARADEPDPEVRIRRALNYGSDGPQAILELLRGDDGDQICLLIDQFEELFTHAKRCGTTQANLLIQFLLGVKNDKASGLNLILTMRSEFLGACAQFPGFAELVNAHQFLLPRLESADLVRAIREPATLYDGQVDADLAERLIQDASTSQEQLPLIQHGLMVLYEELLSAYGPDRSWRLGLGDYQRRGSPLADLLSEHADDVAATAQKLLSNPARESSIIERIFCALTDVNADGKAVRNPQKLAQLVAITGAAENDLRIVLGAFRTEGVSFLRPYGSKALTSEDSVDVSHEALIRSWRKIADPSNGWLMREFKNGLIWRSLLVQCDSFEANPANVLSAATSEERESWLKQRTAPWSERYGGGWERVRCLVEASVAARESAKEQAISDSKAREEEAIRLYKKGREARLLRTGLFVLFALSVGAIVLAALALSARSAAERDRDTATLAEARQKEALAKRDEADRARLLADAKAKVALRNEAAANVAVKSKDSQLRDAVDALESVKQKVPEGSEALADLNKVQQTLDQQVTPLPALAPRVYLQISSDSQRAAAAAFANKVGQRSLSGDLLKVIPPDVHPYTQNELRCFRKAECVAGKELLDILNDQLVQPKLKLVDISGTFEHSKRIRARHYEVWFAPGEISVAQ